MARLTSQVGRAKFNLGQVFGTPGALAALRESGQTPQFFLSRHVRGDWGDVSNGDARCNDESLLDGSRLLSAYKTLKGSRLWIITEATDDSGHRVATTILLPEEY
jgi:hypothetical protein